MAASLPKSLAATIADAFKVPVEAITIEVVATSDKADVTVSFSVPSGQVSVTAP